MRVTTAVRVATLLAVGTTAASAQRVRGVLRDSASGEPIPGAVVWASDAAGRFLARTVSVDSGAFAVPRLIGTARLHVLRIGYRPLDLPAPTDPADSMLLLRMVAVPLQLAAVEAHGERVCPGEHASSTALELWSQARSALFASVVAREANPPRIRIFSYTQTLEPVRRTVIDDSSETKDLVADQSYVAARPAWAFARDGYMTEDGSERTFYAPDESVMLDTAFVGTHCLRSVTADQQHPGDVGVAFEPIGTGGRDTLVDIAGVLWIDSRKAALRSIEFKYTGLEAAARDGSGGDVVFTVNAHGAPMVSRWEIRSAELESEEPESPTGIRRRPQPRAERTVHVVHYLRSGGQVLSIVWGSEAAARSIVAGTVSDDAGRSVSGAHIWLAGRSDTVISDAAGRFVLPSVPPGRYVVMGADSLLARIGVSRALPMSVVVTGDERPTVHLLYLNEASVMSLVCPAGAYRAGTGVVLAKVTTPAGAAIAGATAALYPDSASAAAQARTQSMFTSNGQGYFAVCRLSVGQTAWIRVVKGSTTAIRRVAVLGNDVTPLRVVLAP